MTSIDSTRILLAEIRSRALSLRRRGTESGAGAKSGARDAPSERPGDRSVELARQVAAISPDDPQRHRKAFRAFLQHSLAMECGFERTDDPAFQALLDQVQESMELDVRLRRAMEAAGRLLLAQAGPP
jgi:hypothetical protein